MSSLVVLRTPLRRRLKRALPLLVPVVRAHRRVRQQVAFWREYTPDREVLERAIFPALLEREDLRRVLFVGTAFYTSHYPHIFASRELWTLDIDPEMARYGAPGRHIVDSVTNVAAHFPPQSLDAVLAIGVFGFGVDSRESMEATVTQLVGVLRPGGVFVASWNDAEEHRCHPLDRLESVRRLRPITLGTFPAPTYPTFSDLKVWFAFYERPVQ
ncbi:MAG: class I SAM-dependent methyltransferase [Actinomycetota bacterium]|nr:class I SAM-dependent methyltransferase [Actinomycetota bacterium]